jgi:ankyrin repeat protein
MNAYRQPGRLTAMEVLHRYKEEELPEFLEVPLENVNQAGNSRDRPLHVAAVRGNMDEIAALVAGGADVNAHGDLGNTPLHDAAAQGHLDAVKFLLANGASPDQKNEFDESVVAVANSCGHHEIARLLASPPPFLA